jgi:hypothetical protein
MSVMSSSCRRNSPSASGGTLDAVESFSRNAAIEYAARSTLQRCRRGCVVPASPFFGTRVVKGIPLSDYAALLDERAIDVLIVHHPDAS